jgi:hypothetical protein
MPYEAFKKSLPEGFIDLGEPIKGMEISMIEPAEEKPEIHYPSLYFENAEGLGELPKEGKATIYFKKVIERKETTMRNGKTEKRSTVELCIYGIKANESEESDESEEEDDEDAIENGLEEAEKED